MLSTVDVIKYMQARRIEGTDYIAAAPDDPAMLQAEQDGYAVREDGKWRGLGYIQKGERRIVRHRYGPDSEVTG